MARKGKAKDWYKKFIKSVGVAGLHPYERFIGDDSLRHVRNQETHEDFWKTFAFLICEVASQGKEEYVKFKRQYAEAFEFIYDCTWEQAAEKAKAASNVL